MVDEETVYIENHALFETILQSASEWLKSRQLELADCTAKDRDSTLIKAIQVHYRSLMGKIVILKYSKVYNNI